MAKLVKLQTQQNMLYTPDSSDYVLVTTGLDSQGNITQFVKKSDGSFVTIGGGSSAVLGMVDSQGKFQQLSFDGQTPSNNGQPVEVGTYYSWKGTLPAPQMGAKATAGYITQNEDGTVSFVESSGITESVTELYIPNTGVAEPAYTGQKIIERVTNFYKCASVDTEAKTWSGYLAVLGEDGTYSFEETVTEGLTFGNGFTPVVGGIYNGDATVRIDKLFEGFIIPQGYVLYIPFNTKEGSAATGQSLEYYNEGSIATTTDSGIHCTHFDGGSIGVGYGNLPSGDLSISYWCKFTGTEWGIIYTQPGINTSVENGKAGVGAYTQWGLNGNVDSTQWFHFAVTRSGDSIKVYINGVLANSGTQSLSVSDSYARIGSHFEYNDAYMFKGYLAGLRVYNRALTDDEVTNLSKEFKV